MTLTASSWIEETLASLSVEQKLAQLLHPFIRPEEKEKTFAVMDKQGIEPGGFFIFPATTEETRRCAERIQQRSSVPVVISSDLENGPGRMMRDATVFPDLMALAASGSEADAREMGRACAVEGRAAGIHWTFAPIVDINAHPFNPITNTRSLGDRPETIARLARCLIRSMQEHGMAAAAKHFPGDGFDCRDQHVCTTVNPLSMEQWRRLNGQMFAEAIEAGVWTIMAGHIALPAWDAGEESDLNAAPPATLSRRLLGDLLRGELGFEGLIVSDALTMGGFGSQGPREKILIDCLNAGCEQLLFVDLASDFEILKRAYEEGRISTQRLEEAVRRILALKEKLRIHESPFGPPAPDDEKKSFEASSRRIAESAVTIVQDRFDAIPFKLAGNSRVFSYHLRGDALYNVDGIDETMRERGWEVVRKTEEDDYALPSREELKRFDLILVHFVFGPSWCTNRIRPSGNLLRPLIERIDFNDPKTVFISFGSPYLLCDLPKAPALINAYSPDPNTQEAVLRILTGDLPAKGSSPVEVRFRPETNLVFADRLNGADRKTRQPRKETKP